MNRITKKMKELKDCGTTAFITYITAGDPNIHMTEEIVYALERGGSHIIEIGIPHSDPVADGEIIQNAVQRALKLGIKTKDVFRCVEKIRKNTQIPIVFLVYYNMILAYGIKEFIKECDRSGVDGMIIPDLPLEEKDEIGSYLRNSKVILIPLVAPTSKTRIKKIVEECEGFIYCVSSMGITGQKNAFHKNINQFLKDVRQSTDIPIAVGFGISSMEDVERFKGLVDGIIVGSAIVKHIHTCDGNLKEIEANIASLCN